MTLAQIISEVQSRVGGSTTDPTEAQVTTWVNLGNDHISNRSDWYWLKETLDTGTTTSGTAEYTLPTDFKRMLSVRVGSAASTETSADDYSYVNYADKNLFYDGLASMGDVGYYYINEADAKYGLIPTPATSGYKIYLKYWKTPDTVSAVSATPTLPVRYHEALVDFALANYWEQNDEMDKAVFYNTKLENWIERMRTETVNRSSGELSRIRDIRETMRITNNSILGK